MKKIILLSLLTATTAIGQTEYVATALPARLTENAHSVVRRHEQVFTVKSAAEAVNHIRRVITILDEQGDKQAEWVVFYDKMSRVSHFSGALYDAGGKLISRLKKSDIEDTSTYQDYNLYDDDRQKTARFPRQPVYPYTVEFVVETSEHNMMFYPAWMPQAREHEALEEAIFTVNMPAGLPLRYKEMNLPKPVSVVAPASGGKTYTWQLANRPPIEREPLSPPLREQLPVVYTAPTGFEVQAHSGTLNNWADLSRFYYTLNAGRDKIPDPLRQQVLDLTHNEPTVAGKVRNIYSFLQKNTRYVSIQLGIGGWQTLEADKVATSKYGDCKALTNYAQALLKAAGISAYPVLVGAGKETPDLLTDFPAFQFNHVILCVPNGRDTTFLECTSNYDPPGYVGDFTGSRHALLILPTGGRLIQTPAYAPADNRQQRKIAVTLTDQGDAIASVQTRYTGLQQDKYANVLHAMNHTEQRSWLTGQIPVPSFELLDFTYVQQPGPLPSIRETIELSVRQWANRSGKRLFLPLNLLSATGPAEPLTQARQLPLVLGPSYDLDNSDTIVYQLPKGYVAEYQLPPVIIDTKFGAYKATAAVGNDRVTYVRRLTLHRGRFPASAYAEWADFRRKIARADRLQLVFTKTN